MSDIFGIIGRTFRWLVTGGWVALCVKLLILFPFVITIAIGVVSGIAFGLIHLISYVIHHIGTGIQMGHRLSGT